METACFFFFFFLNHVVFFGISDEAVLCQITKVYEQSHLILKVHVQVTESPVAWAGFLLLSSSNPLNTYLDKHTQLQPRAIYVLGVSKMSVLLLPQACSVNLDTDPVASPHLLLNSFYRQQVLSKLLVAAALGNTGMTVILPAEILLGIYWFSLCTAEEAPSHWSQTNPGV